LIAGKILAAVLTTTAAVTGLCGAEIIKIVSGETDVGKFKSGLMNLATNSYDIMKPLKPKVFKDKAANETDYEYRVIPRPPAVYNSSTRIEFDATGGKTLKDLDTFMCQTHGVGSVADPRHWFLHGYELADLTTIKNASYICSSNDIERWANDKAAYQAAIPEFLGMTFEQIFRKQGLQKLRNEEKYLAIKEGREEAFDE